MDRSSLAVALSLTAFAACGGSSPATSGPATAHPLGAAGSLLELGEITISDGPQAIFKLHADGSTEMAFHKGSMTITPGETASSDSLPVVWEPGPTLHADGTIDGKGKPAVARLTPDGTIVATQTHESLPMTVIGSRLAITAPTGQRMVLDLASDGSVAFPDMPRPEKLHLHVEGAATPGKIKTALVVLGLVMAPSKRVETSTPVETSTAP